VPHVAHESSWIGFFPPHTGHGQKGIGRSIGSAADSTAVTFSGSSGRGAAGGSGARRRGM